MKYKQPVFVCGLARSGTSWISRTLGQSDELEYIGESWMISKLSDLANWCNYILDSYKFNSFTWMEYSDDIKFFVRAIGKFYKELLYNASNGKRFIEKTPNWNLENIELLNEFFPDAYYVLIYRDGRNQVASNEEFSLNKNQHFDFKESCVKWSLSMDKIKFIRKNSQINKYTLIRYEDLLQNFDNIFKELCDFVEIKRFNPAISYNNSSFKESGSRFDFNYRWRSWTDEKRFIFKEKAGKQLIEWGYTDSNDSW